MPQSVSALFLRVIVYFSGPIQLSLDVFLAQLSMSLHTSFVCSLMWYATRLHFCGGSIWGLAAFPPQSFLSLSPSFTRSHKLLRRWLRTPLPCSVTPHFWVHIGRYSNYQSGNVMEMVTLSLFSPGVLINFFSQVDCIIKLPIGCFMSFPLDVAVLGFICFPLTLEWWVYRHVSG